MSPSLFVRSSMISNFSLFELDQKGRYFESRFEEPYSQFASVMWPISTDAWVKIGRHHQLTFQWARGDLSDVLFLNQKLKKKKFIKSLFVYIRTQEH